jgi:hypothetical protein
MVKLEFYATIIPFTMKLQALESNNHRMTPCPC